MPLFDFTCPACGVTREGIFKSYAEMQSAGMKCIPCGVPMEKQASAPATISVRGFNALNHYGAKETKKTVKGETLIGKAGAGMKVTTHEHT